VRFSGNNAEAEKLLEVAKKQSLISRVLLDYHRCLCLSHRKNRTIIFNLFLVRIKPKVIITKFNNKYYKGIKNKKILKR
jgi:hypothetical protein